MEINEALIEKTRKVWEPIYGHPLSREDCVEIIRNAKTYLLTLIEMTNILIKEHEQSQEKTDRDEVLHQGVAAGWVVGGDSPDKLTDE
ncbi:MAG TPA: hypothetical protein PK014_05685 [Thermoanaerobaculia bacterium]|nr:hypothetical protein [Thermoanaerobaculia bacterium]HUM29587.1 hypothetical protein [Thermoanaerobaculia bacterium]HXK67238.1 hypothetical protein [Thermoanaerobaculia bacterium]